VLESNEALQAVALASTRDVFERGHVQSTRWSPGRLAGRNGKPDGPLHEEDLA
jgi:hypothetical protein